MEIKSSVPLRLVHEPHLSILINKLVKQFWIEMLQNRKTFTLNSIELKKQNRLTFLRITVHHTMTIQ